MGYSFSETIWKVLNRRALSQYLCYDREKDK